MSYLEIVTTNGSKTELEESAVRDFETGLRGKLLLQNHDGYEEARKIHNGMIDRRPAMIVRSSGVADVLNAVRLARENNLLLSVCGGGHGVPGFAVCDGGLMIDMSGMNSIHVNPGNKTARAEAGATWGDFDHETQAFGLATTGGLVRPTGIAGLTLAGGHGLLMRKHGLSCDNLLSADVVTADGKFLKVSESDYPDLFWGLRGGGGNFGIVTSFKYRLHQVGPMFGGLVIYPMDQAQKVLRFYHEFTSSAPDELGSIAVLATLPDGTKAVVFLLAYSGTADEGEKVLQPLRSIVPPLDDQVGPVPYTALQSIVENFNPEGLRNYWKTTYLDDLQEKAIDLMVERYANNPSPPSHIVLYTLGGAVNRAGKDETAVAFRDARHIFLIIGMWEDARADQKNLQWIRDLWKSMQPYSRKGFYINYEADTRHEEIKTAYGPEKYERLSALKKKYDPANLFRLNQNIKPII